VSKTLAKKRLA